ncbi:MAG: hypothetical protein HQM03_17375 [Magnetococcales bacterium]|nr:hypothetical protein [Magnetococcales bacterium]
MTTAIACDTLKYAKTLADVQAEVNEQSLGALVTKEYLDAKLERELAPIRTDLAVLKWMLALIIIVLVLPALKTLLG